MKSALNSIYYFTIIRCVVCLRSSALVLFCGIVFSCADDQDGFSTFPVQAVFTTSIGGSGAAFPFNTHINPWTQQENEMNAYSRASGDTWASGDQIGIYMLTAGGSINNVYDIEANNMPYRTTEAGTDVALTPVGKTLYYPNDGSKVNFVAYYPYQSFFNTANVYDVDVSNQSTPANIDLLYHKGTKDHSRYNAAAVLTFEHKLSKITLNVTRGTGVNSDLNALISTITGTPTRANFPLATGILSNQGTVADIASRIITASTTSTQAMQEAIIIPHNGSGTTPVFADRTITFTVGGNTYTYPLPNTINFEAGKVYNYDFTLTRTGIILNSSSITDWEEATITPNGDYTLNVAPSSFSLTKEARSNNSLIIRTSYPSAPGIQFSSNATTVTATSDLVLNSFVRIGTDTNPYTYELKFGVTSTSSNRTRYIHITVGGQTYVVSVSQSSLGIMDVAVKQPSSNCYIVPPGGAPIAIPVSRANEFAAGAIGSSTAFTAELVWADLNAGNNTGIGGDGCITRIETNGTGSSGHIIVHPGRHEGNAVVAVKVNDEIKWSWHIWVTTYNPWTSEGIEMSDGSRAMDRPLGTLHTAGPGQIDLNSGRGCLVYQWGRKDPFALDANTPVYDEYGPALRGEPLEGDVSIELQVKRPHSLTGTSIYKDASLTWMELAMGSLNPCPAGWVIRGEITPAEDYSSHIPVRGYKQRIGDMWFNPRYNRAGSSGGYRWTLNNNSAWEWLATWRNYLGNVQGHTWGNNHLVDIWLWITSMSTYTAIGVRCTKQ